MKRITAILIALVFVLGSAASALASDARVLSALDTLEAAVIKDHGDTAALCESVGEPVSDWLAFTAGRLGEEGCGAYAEAAKKYFDGAKDEMTLPDIQRLSLACAACGGDIEKNGMLAAMLDKLSERELSDVMINQLIFSLHVLDCGLYEIPKEYTITRGDIIREILSRQTECGALYMMSENTPETDITAMAVSALSVYACGDREIGESVDEMVGYLSTQVNGDGTVTNWGAPSCETTAQTIVALCSLGIDPEKDERFSKDGKTLIDGLLSYERSDGCFAHTSDAEFSNDYATAQAYYALVSYARLQNGMRALFDMRSDDTLDISDTAKLKPGDMRYAKGASASFAPDEAASGEGAHIGSPVEPKSGESLSNASGDFTPLESPKQEQTAQVSYSKKGTAGEAAVLIAIGVCAAGVLILDRKVLRKRRLQGK